MKKIVGVFLVLLSGVVHAELWRVTTGDGVFEGATAIAACQAAFAVGGPANNTVSCNGAAVTCSVTVAPSYDPTSCRGVWNYSPVKVEETGCLAKKDQAEFGWITRTVGGPSPYGSFCTGGCEQYVTGPITNPDNPQGEYYTNGKTRTEYAKWQYSGNACNTGTPEPPAKTTPSPTLPKKTPPCAPAEGVMTSSSGTIACVPEGTPESAKPIVDKKKTAESFPDGSKKETETITTRDPVTGVEDRRTTTTTTPNSSGSSGQAGTPGTTTNNSTGGQTPNGSTGSGKEGDSSSDFCAKNPNMQICKGGMNEEGTQKKVLAALSPEETANTDSIKTAKDKYEEKATERKQQIEQAGTSAEGEGLFAWALIPELPPSACSPFSGTVAGHPVVMNWCDELERVRTIAGYAFYILTAFALFSIFANINGGNTK